MRPLILFPLLSMTGVIVISGCTAVRPGVPQSPSVVSPTNIAAIGLTSALGAGIGHEIGGKNGTLIGAGAGAVIGAVASNAIATSNQAKLEEAREQGARDARVEVMDDYWKSHAINGGNSPSSSTNKTGAAKTTTIQYPAGTYDGVEYGPRTVVVPASE